MTPECVHAKGKQINISVPCNGDRFDGEVQAICLHCSCQIKKGNLNELGDVKCWSGKSYLFFVRYRPRLVCCSFTGTMYSLKSQERVQLENGRLMPKTASILEVARIQSVWPLKTAE